MPRDVNGNYTLPLPPVITGTTIEIAWANPTMADLAAAMTDSLSRTGAGGMLDVFKAIDGLVGAPGIVFVTEPTLGFYRAAAGVMGVAIGGNEQAAFDTTNQMTVSRDHGSGIQKFAVADTFTELAAGKTAFDTKYEGFNDDGSHRNFAGDLDNIIVNSLYTIQGTAVTNEPVDFIAGAFGFIHTIIHGDPTSGTQVLYGMDSSNTWKQWMRSKSASVYGAWKLVVDNGAFPLRFDGFADTGLHEEYTGDLNDIIKNSLFNIRGTTVTNEPSDFATSNWGFIHTFVHLVDDFATQVLYGMGEGNAYKIWMRHKETTWGAWILINDGSNLFIKADGQVIVKSGLFRVEGSATPIIDLVSDQTASGGGLFRTLDGASVARLALAIDQATDISKWEIRNSSNTVVAKASLKPSGNIIVEAAAPIEVNDLTRKDYVDALVGGGQIFDAKYEGFEDTGLHEEYTGDLNAVLNNSLYYFKTSTTTNSPLPAGDDGYLNTMIGQIAGQGVQTAWGRAESSSTYKVWMRSLISSVWSAWFKVIQGPAAGLGSIFQFPGLLVPPLEQGMIVADGLVVGRAVYPDLWAMVSASAITEAQWATNSNGGANGVGFYSSGDLSTNFRIPDLMGEFFRANTNHASNEARDPDRTQNSQQWQDSEFASHTHTMENNVTAVNEALAQATGGAAWGRNSVTNATGGSETRGRNLPILTCIKAL